MYRKKIIKKLSIEVMWLRPRFFVMYGTNGPSIRQLSEGTFFNIWDSKSYKISLNQTPNVNDHNRKTHTRYTQTHTYSALTQKRIKWHPNAMEWLRTTKHRKQSCMFASHVLSRFNMGKQRGVGTSSGWMALQGWGQPGFCQCDVSRRHRRIGFLRRV